MTEKPSFQFTPQYYVRAPERQGICVIHEPDWNRLKRMVERIKPGHSWMQTVAGALLGLGGSSLVALLAFLATPQIPAWAIPTCLATFLGGLILGGVITYLDAQYSNHTSLQAKDVLEEMTTIESALSREKEEAAVSSAGATGPREGGEELTKVNVVGPTTDRRTDDAATPVATAPQEGTPET